MVLEYFFINLHSLSKLEANGCVSVLHVNVVKSFIEALKFPLYFHCECVLSAQCRWKSTILSAPFTLYTDICTWMNVFFSSLRQTPKHPQPTVTLLCPENRHLILASEIVGECGSEQLAWSALLCRRSWGESFVLWSFLLLRNLFYVQYSMDENKCVLWGTIRAAQFWSNI